MTPYMKFHPGSKEELMKGAGIDCTILFDEVRKKKRCKRKSRFTGISQHFTLSLHSMIIAD